ncbi:hypothetical protein BCL90_1285 [Pedobacter alluvionis]|uniref:Uncharacterized protein n=1 Tax=Pedobacter alluvionis TaxID=475253 RepID=A0A497YBD4_9SPHI|nr:hypothetical protein BCL90_1285 [Pedobacter alluvionis]
MLTHLLQKTLVLKLLTGLCLNSWSQKEIAVKSFELSEMQYLIRWREMYVVQIQKNGWKQRLQTAKATGLNTVCAYLFGICMKNSPISLPGSKTF